MRLQQKGRQHVARGQIEIVTGAVEVRGHTRDEIGAVLLTALPEALTSLEGWDTVAFGSILVVCMIFVPNGLVPTLAARFSKEEDDGAA